MTKPTNGPSSRKEAMHEATPVFLASKDKVAVLLKHFAHPEKVLLQGQDSLLGERLTTLACLDFLGWAFLDEARLSRALSQSQLSEQERREIASFINSHLEWRDLLVRLQREGEGYANEVTGMYSRPMLLLKSREPAIHIRLRSHDKIVLTSIQGIVGFASMTDSLVLTLGKFIEYMRAVNPEMASDIIESETFQALRRSCEGFLKLASGDAIHSA